MGDFKTKSGIPIGRLPAGEWQILNKPTHEKTETLFNYWQSKLGNTLMPRRSAIDPIQIPQLMPMTAILEVEHAERVRFKVRLYGTAAVEVAGEERTGRYIDEFGQGLSEAARKEVVARWQKGCMAAYDSCAPIFSHGLRSDPQKSHHLIHTAALPLTIDGKTVSHILGAMTAETPKAFEHTLD